jgi:hypothetical protein
MTEEEWLATADPDIVNMPSPPLDNYRMLSHVQVQYTALRKRKLCERKLRLFACACCQRHWSVMTTAAREVVTLAEQFAEGRQTRTAFAALRRRADLPQSGTDIHSPDHLARWLIEPQALTAAYHTSRISYNLV